MPEDRRDESLERYPLELFLCAECGHVQMLDVIDPEVLFGNYEYVTSSSPGLVKHFQDHAAIVIEKTRPADGCRFVQYTKCETSEP